jgi:hypothetical protein
MTKTSAAVLYPVAFSARRCRGNEVRLHSHLGKGFTGDWAMNKCRHMLFGQHFVWVTNCYGIRFVLFYDGANHAILWLQMRLMCWDVDIVHQNNSYIMDANYWSRLGTNLCFNPLFKTYLDLNRSLCLESPAPSSFPTKPKNMPYYRRPRIMPPTDTDDTSYAAHCQAIVSTIMIKNCHSLCHLSNDPIQFGNCGKVTPPNAQLLHNDKFPCYAQQVLQFSWAVYSFQGGHFASTIQSWNLPFHISLVCDPYKTGCSLFQEFTSCCQIFNSSMDMLNHISASGDTSVIHGYLIQSPHFQTSDTTTKFWQLQAIIIAQLCLICSLSIIVAIIHPDHDGRSVKSFQPTLKSSGWIIASTNIFYPDQATLLLGHAMSSLLSAHQLHQWLIPCFSNGHLRCPHVLSGNSCGNLSINPSMLFH